MGKIHVSMNELERNFRHVFRIPNEAAHHLLYFHSPVFYNAGVNGWNCTVYVYPNYDLAICTGDRNLRGLRVPDDLLLKYEEFARSQIRDWTLTYETRKSRLDESFAQFIQDLFEYEESLKVNK